jgi:hypothetical protein
MTTMPLGTLLLFYGLVVPPHWEDVSPRSKVWPVCEQMMRTTMIDRARDPLKNLHCIIKVDEDHD